MSAKSGLLSLACLIAFAAPAFAQGLVIPDEPELPPLALTKHAVRVEIDQQAAATTVEQVFQNHTDRQLEAHYVFPIPKGAVVSRFTMLVNGKEKAGEMVEKGKAREIYNSIVRRAQDPGLLEYLGNDIFRANIFPIAPRGSQTITVRFEQVLASESALVSYTYPVRASAKKGTTVHGEFSIEVGVKSAQPILNLYSPSHAVDIVRAGEKEAKVSYSKKNAPLDKDFQLFYGVSDKEIGFNLVTHRPDPKQPGTFMMLLTPRSKRAEERLVARDLVFVIDVSGSMSGEKIKQARAALKYCVENLNDTDRFNIVTFSSSAEAWKKDLVPAVEYRKAGSAFADALLPQGGTNIAEALDVGLSFPKDPSRPYFVIFLTDGKPTLGETVEPGKLIAKVERARAAAKDATIRLFSWGVGYDLDAQLLDGLAEAAGGVAEYVRPEENIEAKLATFWNKAGKPVPTGLAVQLLGDKVQLVNVYPKTLPDLYAGSQLVVFGQYTGEGDAAIKLDGRVNQATESFTFEGKFMPEEKKHAFVPPLWAKRRIGHLLEEIRRHGEKKELVDDVVRLSMEYGIQTPYTSSLILEDGMHLGAANDPRSGEQNARRDRALDEFRKKAEADKSVRGLAAEPAKPTAGPAPEAKAPAGGFAGKPPSEEAERLAATEKAKSLTAGLKGDKDGKTAVDTAGWLRQMKEAESGASDVGRLATCRKAAGTRFFSFRGCWVDERFESQCAVTVVKFGSEAYFKLLEARPELLEAFKMGTEVLCFTAAGKAVAVAPEGEEKLTEAQIADLFKAVEKTK